MQKYSCNHIIEPLEPIRAYELSSLMWMNGSKITEVELNNNSIKIMFENKKYLTILNETDMDNAWILYGMNDNEIMEAWSITCECDGSLFVERPF
ncbi:hypothetical protein Curi_c14530 [Gottschalkia acidurici 9a]|uniref:Uncharacterized protein n=1 Tax=Gottschalkia acidurici (strain ATCC 7906 / DSM 604 / BCRC 14475 / CIP 104303 / KCTC 5404 / NCIMB 10678 / 9a) TaxID=1128398 RepID=K0AXC8_GOTA9|nr:hypothetical protein [Gottschalkia acidurici]AFS78463.1 hypothetical protein Curi_c14530 [Gottschalkia acidurici 9a]